jgi:hypothetical protein
MMDAAGSSETPVHIYQATQHHIPKNGYLQDNILLPTAAAALHCNPQAAFFCNLLSFHFQNIAIATVCWMREIRKRERDFFL